MDGDLLSFDKGMVRGEVARDAEPMEDPEDAACKYTRPLVYAAAHGDLPKVSCLGTAWELG